MRTDCRSQNIFHDPRYLFQARSGREICICSRYLSKFFPIDPISRDLHVLIIRLSRLIVLAMGIRGQSVMFELARPRSELHLDFAAYENKVPDHSDGFFCYNHRVNREPGWLRN